jgi:hypothetical protein
MPVGCRYCLGVNFISIVKYFPGSAKECMMAE